VGCDFDTISDEQKRCFIVSMQQFYKQDLNVQ